ncbi:MAG: sigma-70 family RNA polymerase sigma factor [Pedobacter sp.]|uniref:RNA polymerase sigma factor n=1 Tax=Pedobacter sp. TaxID=1411316 RepID=UPI003397A183
MADGVRETWQKFIEGSYDALDDIYAQHYLGLINYGIKLTGDRQQANDCFVEMLIQLWEKRNRLPQVENVRSYLMTCLRTLIYQKLRSDRLREMKETYAHSLIDQEEISYEDYITKIQTDSAIKAKLQRSLEKLSDRQRELLQYRFFDAMDYDEIALKCGISKKTAYNIVYDALTRLKDDLGKENNGNNLYLLALIFITFSSIC